MTAPQILPGPGVKMSAANEPGLKFRVRHGPSSAQILLEPPKDNGGSGMSFSPTDLLGAALASCALASMTLAASREDIPFGTAEADVEKRMTAAPRRVGELAVDIRMPAGLSAAHRARLEEVARGCPVARSLSPELHAPMRFTYPD